MGSDPRSAVAQWSDGKVVVITLQRPERANALDLQMLAVLDEALTEAERSRRPVVLTGEGRHFCAGADVASLQSADRDAVASRAWMVIERVQNLEVPVIAALNGAAVGGGAELALSCDLRIGSPESYLQARGVRWGAVTCCRLARYLPLGLATEAIWLERRIPAEEAAHWGLVNQVVRREGLRDAAVELAQTLAELPPDVVVHSRRLLRSTHVTWDAVLVRQADDSDAAWKRDRAGLGASRNANSTGRLVDNETSVP